MTFLNIFNISPSCEAAKKGLASLGVAPPYLRSTFAVGPTKGAKLWRSYKGATAKAARGCLASSF